MAAAVSPWYPLRSACTTALVREPVRWREDVNVLRERLTKDDPGGTATPGLEILEVAAGAGGGVAAGGCAAVDPELCRPAHVPTRVRRRAPPGDRAPPRRSGGSSRARWPPRPR